MPPVSRSVRRLVEQGLDPLSRALSRPQGTPAGLRLLAEELRMSAVRRVLKKTN